MQRNECSNATPESTCVIVVAMLLACLGLPAFAQGQGANVLQVARVTAEAGEMEVVVPISLAVDQDLTRLSFMLSYDTAVLDAVALRKAGRTIKDPEEGGINDETGTIGVAILDLTGGIVIPAGAGGILEVVFNVESGAPTDEYPLTVSGLTARYGPLGVPVTAEDGAVTVVAAHWEFLISSITQDWESTHDVTITWESEVGRDYEVSVKDDLMGVFNVTDTVTGADMETSWTDDGLWGGGTHPATVGQRYYQVTDTATGKDSLNTVGMYRITVQEGMNLCGMPLVPMASSLEGVLGTQITGADNERDADRVWAWNGTNYEFAWLIEGVGPPFDGSWYTGSSPTTVSLGPDQGFWVQVREGHGDTNLFFLGELSRVDRVIPLNVGMNLVAPSYPRSIPLGDQAPDDANFWESGATGADNERDADRVWNWTGTNYQFHWLVDGVDPLYDGQWFMGNNPSTLWIEPGKGYWVQIREGHSPLDWICPVADSDMEGPDYEVTTSVISGGGAFLNSDSYQVQCTLGQSYSLVEQNSASYSLSPGFWNTFGAGASRP